MTLLADFCGNDLSFSVPECGAETPDFSIKENTEVKDRVTAKPISSDSGLETVQLLFMLGGDCLDEVALSLNADGSLSLEMPDEQSPEQRWIFEDPSPTT